MAKAARRIRELLQLIDVVIEVVDARVVRSGRNPLLEALAARRARVVALTRQDLADPAVTKRWLEQIAGKGYPAVAVDGRVPRSVARVAALVANASSRSPHAGGISRAMIIGIPNSGKSSIINAMLRRGAARTEDRAGVTRQMQWFRLARNAELMDTPGVLPPKISGAGAQWRLALCGAVPQDRYDPQEVAGAFHRWLREQRAGANIPDLEAFAAQRGFLRRGGETDYHNAALSYVRAFNEGVFGRISLEDPDDSEAA